MITVLQGDMLAVLPTLAADSLDSCVCDPPYHLQSIHKRFAAKERDETSERYAAGAYGRHATGFMGKQWDGGDVSFRPETWVEVFRVLKPGAHLVAFGGTRTFHRMACAIEDAGFEIRDTLAWLYGSGFPKSHDVSKGIDKAGAKTDEDVQRMKTEIQRVFDACGMTLSELNLKCGFEASGYLGTSSTWERVLPSAEKWWIMRNVIGCDEDFSFQYKDIERQIIGVNPWTNSASHFTPGANHTVRKTLNVTAPATDAARQWSGWGTALKPAYEPIILARKPLIGTVVANVLRHGTGGLNIDGCRVEGGERPWREPAVPLSGAGAHVYGDYALEGSRAVADTSLGRWPANVCHDGSDEVMAGFPSTIVSGSNDKRGGCKFFLGGDQRETPSGASLAESGSAARFFYTAKADKSDRLGSKHPTVKPVDLMRWLTRLVTPPGGTILDCFAGSGTTGMAALAEGFNAVLIEREAEYVADIRRRLQHVSGADSPLFAEIAP